ncbi:GNAT domain-domain-containing protein [Clohesyomyces aquaticus]|uniref:GNAT domain-domain-containing protein n=1 Tax=Clohesyomyces aquaticus TaxID=1231657 RepID=A0A1Y2A2E9_9PLEO|nr:GNAT domain-domain-containing protein [Clohesyomyces aquaticus]
MDPTISTPRLQLTLLTKTDLDSNHVKWFHELRSDEMCTSWSMRGRMHSLSESRDFLTECLTQHASIHYAVHVKPSGSPPSPSNDKEIETETPRYSPVYGELIGEISLRDPDASPQLPPPKPRSTTQDHSSPPTIPSPFNFRILGYAFLQSSWGHGYATEANAAMLSAWGAFCRREDKSKLSYVEAGVGRGNPASLKVVEKLGFEKVGWRVADRPAFLGGKWQEPGYWIWGMYV